MKDVKEYIISTDSSGNKLNGSNFYKLILPGVMPVCEFWSVIVFDSLTRFIISTDQSWPSVHSTCKHLIVNADGSVDIWFGPDIPGDNQRNWIKTLPQKEWYTLIRIYNPDKPDPSGWEPGEIEAYIGPQT